MTDGARLFLGARLSMATLRAIEAALPGLKQSASQSGLDVRWVPPENYHVTLKFLGWARREVLPAVEDRVTRALSDLSEFSFDVTGAGAFPSPDSARVLWVGVSGPGEKALQNLAARIDSVCKDLGFPAEIRPFHAHITLGRLPEPADVANLLEPLQSQTYASSPVEDVVLFESVQAAGQISYEQRAVLPLGSR